MPESRSQPLNTGTNIQWMAWFQDAMKWEAQCIQQTASSLGVNATRAIRAITDCRGRIVFTGMGKMGYIAHKAASTFCSTGTPSLFLHPGEAFHGDLGMVCQGDLLVALSGGGETKEVIELVPFMRSRGIEVIAITCRPESTLAKVAQIVLPMQVDREANPDSSAPTASTTVALAICDGLAISVMRSRGFTQQQFAELHPGGFIGRKLLTTVNDLMHTGDRLPLISDSARIREAILTISEKGLGCAFVVNQQGKLLGIFTDGDLRRTLARHINPLEEPVVEFMTRNPATIPAEILAAEAIRLMESRSITVLPIVDSSSVPQGVIHLHDLVQAGLV